MSNYVALKPTFPELTRTHIAYTPEGYISLCGLKMPWELGAEIVPDKACPTCMKAYRERLGALQGQVREETQTHE